MGIDQYPAESLVVPAVVMDIRDKAAVNADYALTLPMFGTWNNNGLVPAGSVVLLYTGWQDLWFDRYAFLNPDAEGGLHFPAGYNATQFLLHERQIADVGTDTMVWTRSG